MIITLEVQQSTPTTSGFIYSILFSHAQMPRIQARFASHVKLYLFKLIVATTIALSGQHLVIHLLALIK